MRVGPHRRDVTLLGSLALPLVLSGFLVPITMIDLRRRIIPNRLTGAAALTVIPLVVVIDPASGPERLVSAIVAGGAFLAVALASPAGMGMGDVKLVAVLGLYLGSDVAVAVMVALVAGTVSGLVIVARRGIRDGRRTTIPFGPFLVLGGAVAVVTGGPLLELYLDRF
jgi:prepilin signal peptidase PulO-like enzyme (type II secretory pathway)